MPRTYWKEFFFRSKTFCCCLPVRFGLISMSFLGILFGGILSIICWFEVANVELEAPTKAALIVGGLVETILFAASMLGFIGAIVRKQSFVQTYAYILYVHFVLNLAVAVYLLVMVTKAASTAVVKACQQTVKNTGAQDQCTGLLKSVRLVIVGVSAVVLFVELYGAMIAARYLNQIKVEKRTARSSRIQAAEEYEIQTRKRTSGITPGFSPPSDFSQDFNPYEAANVHHDRSTAGSSHSYQSVPLLLQDGNEAYDGERRTHGQLEEEDEARMRKPGDAQDDVAFPNPFLSRDETGGAVKTVYRPSQPADENELPPRYS
ncbi:hypothetical protein E1B28_000537 [Marasmius oreades]|uniref:Uncharacterized protein n=1 Tax=Marasmius oreades TaxID=181124 RepID=A0A9P7V1P1_9AGAR|nr:uncharacterized protein E1B28_000537 [Marasmius oreades]KAG7098615.1 hypothetical protein E1B28_000537 [Marasmius oreades]